MKSSNKHRNKEQQQAQAGNAGKTRVMILLSPEQRQFFKPPSTRWTFPTSSFLARQRASDSTSTGQMLRCTNSAEQLASGTKLIPSTLLFQEDLLPEMKAPLARFQSLPQTSFLERHKLRDVCPKQNERHSSPFENHQSLKVNASRSFSIANSFLIQS